MAETHQNAALINFKLCIDLGLSLCMESNISYIFFSVFKYSLTPYIFGSNDLAP